MTGLTLGWGVRFAKRPHDWGIVLGLITLIYMFQGFAPYVAIVVWALAFWAAVVLILGIPVLFVRSRSILIALSAAMTVLVLMSSLRGLLDAPITAIPIWIGRGSLLLFAVILLLRAQRDPLFGSALHPRPRPLSIDPTKHPRTEVRRARQRFRMVENAAVHPFKLVKRIPLYAHFDLRYLAPYIPLIIRYSSHVIYNRAKRPIMSWVRGRDQFADGVELFSRFIPRSPMTENFMTDEAFARFRLTGPSVLGLRKLRGPDLDEVFPGLPIAEIAALLSDGKPESTTSLAHAVSCGQAFYVRCRMLERVLDGPYQREDVFEGGQKVLTRAAALFRASHGALVPVAIRIDLDDDRVYTPRDGVRWDIAKMYFQVADHNEHYMGSHLGRGHFLMEPIAASVPRNLSYDHPIHILLEPHLRYTLPAIRAALKRLVSPGYAYNRIFAGDLELCRKMIQATRTVRLRSLCPRQDLTERGMLGADLKYPYREDALAYWDMIHRYVRRYLTRCYGQGDLDRALADDLELRDWLTELTSELDGSLLTVPAGAAGHFDEVVSVVTLVIFNAGPAHAVLHFAPIDYHLFVPGFPAAAYALPNDLLGADNVIELNDFLARMLPPFRHAIRQFDLSHLGDHHFECFGEYTAYRLSALDDGELCAAQREFKESLLELERVIERRDADPSWPRYPYLRPSRVPNSANV